MLLASGSVPMRIRPVSAWNVYMRGTVGRKTAGDPDRRRGVCGREACRVTLWLLPGDIVYIEAFAHNTAIYIYSNMQ